MNLVLHSERLTLTPVCESDLSLVTDVFTDPEVMRFSSGAMGKKEIRKNMPNWTRRGGNGCNGIWCISDRSRDEKLGTVALLPMPVEDKMTDYSLVIPGRMPDGDIEIGYYLKRSAWGNGYATEACKRLLQMAFEESPLTEVVATFDVGNTGSQRVLEKAGFVNHGTMRCYGTEGPNYRITRREWSESSRSA